MLGSRVVVCLLVQNRSLVKTKRFSEPKYLGDPLNVIRIFNEKDVDELVVLDIRATLNGYPPDLSMISAIANECTMPLSYGGGVRSADEVERLVQMGVEKVVLGSVLFDDLSVLETSATRLGSQSLTVAIDVKVQNSENLSYQVFARSGSQSTGRCPVKWAKKVEEHGAGEILLTSVDREGTRLGYDLDLIAQVRAELAVPLTALGGAGTYADLKDLAHKEHLIGLGAGSLFTLQGRFDALLPRYPNSREREALFAASST